jgi:hypothetical protein
MIQQLHSCKNFTRNDNLNKTCRNEKRCVLISYDVKCREYEVIDGKRNNN